MHTRTLSEDELWNEIQELRGDLERIQGELDELKCRVSSCENDVDKRGEEE